MLIVLFVFITQDYTPLWGADVTTTTGAATTTTALTTTTVA
jgi:hypothetical protein